MLTETQQTHVYPSIMHMRTYARVAVCECVCTVCECECTICEHVYLHVHVFVC